MNAPRRFMVNVLRGCGGVADSRVVLESGLRSSGVTVAVAS
ncbi:hypothetical protein [Jonesia quinghaiensis]|nr:hypothetical protein [Jonesia quinghaiensis]